jgi:uncharacterized metal-binding protein
VIYVHAAIMAWHGLTFVWRPWSTMFPHGGLWWQVGLLHHWEEPRRDI